MSRALAGMFVILTLPLTVWADEPLPAPRKVAPAGPMYPTFLRTNRYDVWQYYGVNRWGLWRPRVVYSPYGSFYQFDGYPFPWAMSRPREWQRNLAGTPYRYPPLPPPVYMPLIED